MIRKTLGQRIRELRELRDISLREFAKRIEVTAAHQSDIELGRRFPSDVVLKRSAKELGVDSAELQQYDNRLPVERIRRIIQNDPTFGFALRSVVDKDVKAEELLELSKKKRKREGGE